MEIKRIHIIGLIAAGLLLGSSFFFIGDKLFFFIIGLGVLIGSTPFVFTVLYEIKVAGEKEEMFLEFARNLVESVKAGTPISKSIVNVKNKSYGVLSENIEKLANQISLGIPLNIALKVFSQDVDNKTISRALTLIGQAERAGGNIGGILESVAEAVYVSEKLKKERRAAISSLVVQGYIIFFIFMLIILVMEFKILPMVSGIAEVSAQGIGLGGEKITQQDISSSFLYLLLVQGFFTGLAIGKLAEGTSKAGIKHSFVLMLSSFLVSSGANLFFG
jgi:flagellar protein FlaJ